MKPASGVLARRTLNSMFSAITPLLMLLCISTFAQSILAQRAKDDGRSSAALDKLVDVGGGRRLQINCSGISPEGMPTVLLESGAGNDSSVWNRVQPEVSKFTRLCSYNRAGLASSDPVPAPRTVVAVTDQLHLALQRDLMRRSTRGKQIIAKTSGHMIHQDQPELVIDAIRQVVKEVKTTSGKRR